MAVRREDVVGGFHLVGRDVDSTALQGDEPVLPVSEIEFRGTGPEVEPIRCIKLPLCEQ